MLLGSIGDVVRALPLLGRMRRGWPQTHIAWAVEPKSRAIVEGHRWLDELIVYERARAPLSFLPFLWRVRRGGFDLVLDLQRHLKSGLISRLSGAPIRAGFAAANTKEFNQLFNNRHLEPQPNMRLKLMQYQAFGDLLGLPEAPVEFGLEPNAAQLNRAKELLAGAPAPRLGVILGSSWPSRLWFPEYIAEVVRETHEKIGGSAVLIGSRDEDPIAREVARLSTGVPLANLCGRTRLDELPGVFASCVATFGPDCGPMHIAAAVRCPVVSLWGSTAPERSAPWGYANLAISGAIPCHPCYLRRCPIGRECMRRITPAEVMDALERAMAGRDKAPT